MKMRINDQMSYNSKYDKQYVAFNLSLSISQWRAVNLSVKRYQNIIIWTKVLLLENVDVGEHEHMIGRLRKIRFQR